MFKISGFHKCTEVDSYEDGCIGGGTDCYFDYPISATTIPELKAKIAAFIGCDVGDMESDACGEIGRIDAGQTEDGEGTEATKAEIAAWKDGKKELFYASYTCYVVSETPVSVAA